MLVVIESLGYLEYVILGIDFHFSQAEVCEKYTIVNIDLIFFKNGNLLKQYYSLFSFNESR